MTASGGSPDFLLFDGPDHAATVEVVSLMDGPSGKTSDDATPGSKTI